MDTLYKIESYDDVTDENDSPYIPYSTYKSEYTKWEIDEFENNGVWHYPQVFNPTADFYKLEGKVKNIAGTILDKVTVIIMIYDSKWTYQEEHSVTTINLPSGKTWTFTLRLENTFDPSGKNIDFPPLAKIGFEVIADE
jgi:hypothetical protein